MRILSVKNLRFPGEGSSALGKSGPKVRLKSVADGHQVYIPELVIKLIGATEEDNVRPLVDWGREYKSVMEANPYH